MRQHILVRREDDADEQLIHGRQMARRLPVVGLVAVLPSAAAQQRSSAAAQQRSSAAAGSGFVVLYLYDRPEYDHTASPMAGLESLGTSG